jgi:spore coat polysaccharide biosynthesis protein SpsF (cytidylyltransferase family)
MKQIKDICLIVQARLSSERCPRKMIRTFAGSNLVEICLKKLKQSEVFDQSNIYLSVYDKELVDVAEKNNINVFHRSEHSANI